MNQKHSKFTLRTLLFISFVFISTIPVIILSLWVYDSALKKEYTAVHEKHLIIAKNLTNSLSRYIVDLKTGLRIVSFDKQNNPPSKSLLQFFNTLHVKQIWFMNNNLKNKAWLHATTQNKAQIPDYLKQYLTKNKDKINLNNSQSHISGILGNDTSAKLFCVVRRLDRDTLLVATVGTEYILKIQKAISFGKRGHAAIVDQSGRVLAHPLKSWVNSMKDISAISPVKKMQNRITGVTQFYSPALEADMIAGHTFVKETGWGVMIPQPVRELEKRADYVKAVALLIAFMGILIAGTISWGMASYITAPLSALVNYANKIAAGTNNELNIKEQRLRPREVSVLLSAFKDMTVKLQEKTTALETTSCRLKEAQRIAKLGNWELDPISNTMWWSNELYNMLGIVRDEKIEPAFNDFISMMNVGDRNRFIDCIHSIEPFNENSVDIETNLTNILNRTLYVQHKIISKTTPGTDRLIIQGTIQDISNSLQHNTGIHQQS
ncbi:hypothetical protein MNBD_GAMMA12-22 [hydrothermal vent metagenome]|uniref:HAMP domain-containing protein n=1 Tax=hydrothermal vent metagenome TaxID=652676 RepID=A0A3B0XTV8_9ZZZZ